MASSSAIRAGQAFVEFTLRDGKLRKGLKKWEGRFRAFGAGLSRIGGMAASVGGAVTGGFAAATRVFIGSGDQLQKMALRTGMSVEALSELSYAAGQSGTSLGAIEKATRGMARTILDAERGLSTATDNLKDLGLSLSDLKGLKPEGQFKLMASRIAAVGDPTRRAALAMKAFGKSGTELLPMLADGAEGVESLIKQGHDLGLIMSNEDAQAAAVLGDRFDDLWSQLKRVVFLVGAAVAGPLTQFVSATAPILKTIIEWFNANRRLVATIAVVGVALLAAGSVIIGAGVAFQVLAFAAAGLSMAIGAVGAVITFLLSPVGLVVAAVAGLTAAFLTMTETGRGLVSNLGAWFGQLATIATTSFGAIAGALAAGDIEAAGNVLWTALKLLWLQGTASLRETWHKLTGGIAKAWHMTWAGMLTLANTVWGNLERAWSHTTEFILGMWDNSILMMKQGLNSLIGFFQKAWAWITGASDAELARIDAEVSASNRIMGDETSAKITARTEASQKAREDSRVMQAAVLDQIGADLAAKLAGSDDGTKDRIAAAQQRLDEAKAAWQTATATADAVAEEHERQKAENAQLTGGLGDGMEAAADGTTSLGTFNADAVIALQGGGTAEEETAENTAEMVKEQKETNRRLREGGGLIAKT